MTLLAHSEPMQILPKGRVAPRALSSSVFKKFINDFKRLFKRRPIQKCIHPKGGVLHPPVCVPYPPVRVLHPPVCVP